MWVKKYMEYVKCCLKTEKCCLKTQTKQALDTLRAMFSPLTK